MHTIDLPRDLAPHYTIDGENVRTALDWQIAGGGKRRGKKAAMRHASDDSYAVMLWKSGNTTIYAKTRDGGEVARIRYTD